jgi:16S rRNA U516 pseudouridylate synthase RsuA-like enzyme
MRVKVGDFALADLAVGKWRELSKAERAQVFAR